MTLIVKNSPPPVPALFQITRQRFLDEFTVNLCARIDIGFVFAAPPHFAAHECIWSESQLVADQIGVAVDFCVDGDLIGADLEVTANVSQNLYGVSCQPGPVTDILVDRHFLTGSDNMTRDRRGDTNVLPSCAHVIAHVRLDLNVLCGDDDIAGYICIDRNSTSSGNKVTVDCGPHIHLTACRIDVVIDWLLDQQYFFGGLGPREGSDSSNDSSEHE